MVVAKPPPKIRENKSLKKSINVSEITGGIAKKPTTNTAANTFTPNDNPILKGESLPINVLLRTCFDFQKYVLVSLGLSSFVCCFKNKACSNVATTMQERLFEFSETSKKHEVCVCWLQISVPNIWECIPI